MTHLVCLHECTELLVTPVQPEIEVLILYRLDKDKGGHFTISPVQTENLTTKQQYLPSSNILQTRFLQEDGVLNLIDFFPRPINAESLRATLDRASNHPRRVQDPQGVLKKWLVRRVECIRGEVEIDIEVFPAFNYAKDVHTIEINKSEDALDSESHQSVIFKSKDLSLQLSATIDCGDEPGQTCPALSFKKKAMKSSLGVAVIARVTLKEGQAISFVMRELDQPGDEEHITSAMLDQVQGDTAIFWYNWISMSKYKGRWREVVARSLMILKMVCSIGYWLL